MKHASIQEHERRGARCWLSAIVMFLASLAGGCGSDDGQMLCSTDGDCPADERCVTSGGVLFGDRICVLETTSSLEDAGDTGIGSDSTDGDEERSDRDDDRVEDQEDNCPDESNRWQWDLDDDGIGNACDNCEWRDNSDQIDTDADGDGDECDDDDDGDGLEDGEDNCPLVANPDQQDLNTDGVGDACQT